MFFICFSTYPANAVDEIYFEDDFTSSPLDSTKWSQENNGGEISVVDGFLNLSGISTTNFPLVVSNISSIPDSGNYSIEIGFKYPSTTPWGTGIMIGNVAPSYSTSPSDADLYHFLVWQSTNDHFLVQTRHCATNLICDDARTSIYTSAVSSDEHVLKITYLDDHFELVLDGSEIEDPSLLSSSRRPTKISFGNYVQTDNLTWTSISIDYVRIYRVNIEEESSELPVAVVVPGFGASWDYDAILTGSAGTDWKIPSFVKLYDNLINSLINAGYEKDKNLFVFGYDWRKGLSSLADDLNNYVDSLISQGKIESTDKIDFIGHSYGGLVARTYGQNIGTEKVNKIITAGSPHQGIIDSYGVWEGATVWKNVWWQRAGLELMIKLNQQAGENRVDTVRRLASGIKDTLPTFDFIKKDGVVVDSDTLLQKNSTLAGLNSDISGIDELTWANGGENNQTDSFLKVVVRTWLDKTKGLWEDGKPSESPFETTVDGDGAVLSQSAIGTFANKSLVTANHEQIVSTEESVKKIFEELSLDQSKVVIGDEPDSRKSVFIAALRSPGELHVCAETVCDGDLGIYLPDEKLFFLPDYDSAELETSVVAGGETGSYKLYVGKMTDGNADWVDRRGNLVTTTQTDSYQVSPGVSGITITSDVETNSRDFDEDLNVLNLLLPNWDKKGLVAIARSEEQLKNKRIVAIRQLRELLSTLAITAYKNNRPDRIEAMIDVWMDLDELSESVITDTNTTKVSVLNANINLVESVKILADNLLRNSSSLYAGTFYEMFADKFDEAKEIKVLRRDLALDKTLSARYLLQTALGVK